MASSGENLGRVTSRWTPEEDEKLERLVNQHGGRGWSQISEHFPGRTGKSCRLRWCNQLSPDVNRRPFTPEEDEVIINAYSQMGSRWAIIARRLEGRTDNAVKNRWNSTLRRKCIALAHDGGSIESEPQADQPPLRRTTNSDPSADFSIGSCINPISPTVSSNFEGYRPMVEDDPLPFPGDHVSFTKFYHQGSTLLPTQESSAQFSDPETVLSLSLPRPNIGEPLNLGSEAFSGFNMQTLVDQSYQEPPIPLPPTSLALHPLSSPPPQAQDSPLVPPSLAEADPFLLQMMTSLLPPQTPLSPPNATPLTSGMGEGIGAVEGNARGNGFQKMLEELTLDEVKQYMEQNRNQMNACGEVCFCSVEEISNRVLSRLGVYKMQ